MKTEEHTIRPDYIFEVSWEVCNKVGGIHTVISTKALSLVSEWEEKYILIGPDIWKGTGEHPEFREDRGLFSGWRAQAESAGLRIKVGRWKITGSPVVILVDFTSFFQKKDEIFRDLWLHSKVNSLNGQWDYIEPALFGYAAGKVIESFYYCHAPLSNAVAAQFHEWMTGAGLLYLHQRVPQIGTVFTTHATVTGRSIAGNNLPLYGKLDTYDGEQEARRFNVVSKHSLEKRSAECADCFTTVSEITANECAKLLGREPDELTPNGFEDSFVPDAMLYKEKKKIARQKLLEVAERVLKKKLPADSLLVLKSGRYEFRNKGIDVFIDSLAELSRQEDMDKDIVAFLFIPAHNTGPRKDFSSSDRFENLFLTHHLQGAENDPIIRQLKRSGLKNSPGSKIHVIFSPVYLDGRDGIYNTNYYDLLIGIDLSVFASYYEPWGYTPVESLAFRVPAITTSVSGFGRFVERNGLNKAIHVVPRTDDNYNETVNRVASIVKEFTGKPAAEKESIRSESADISKKLLWKNLVGHYLSAYTKALAKARERDAHLHPQEEEDAWKYSLYRSSLYGQSRPVWRKIFIRSEIPGSLKPLQKLAMNLWWTWNHEAEELFAMIDPVRWHESGRNPVALLEQLTLEDIQRLEQDRAFVDKMKMVSLLFEEYMGEKVHEQRPLVAYFCMEYGFHASLKLYSGGLGILAADLLKEASDSGVNLIGIGIFYRKGFFRQHIAPNGGQVAEADLQKSTSLPLQPVRSKDGEWVKITIPFPGRTLFAKAWKIDVGRVSLYLLDTDIHENSADDRSITYQLYEGDPENRLRQEILLGIGGMRLLHLLDLFPDVYHCNEGHAAFMGIERLNRLVLEENITFDEAVEVARSSSLFTTHTPLASAHDKFNEEMLRPYFSHYPQVFNITWEKLMGLGKIDPDDRHEPFSLSYLAASLSQEINAVSEIHKHVTRKIFSSLWPGYAEDEISIGHVTNGAHPGTWVAKEWKTEGLENLAMLPDARIWDIHRALKRRLVDVLQANPKYPLELPDKDFLLACFAKRMVSYKRADLLFRDPERLARIVQRKDRPVLLAFSGKAHPNDHEAQEVLKRIISFIGQPPFRGKIVFIENYDMQIAGLLTQGVDLWLNTPIWGMEASGTSGMKAAMNGVLNLSVADGWWAEAYSKDCGWKIPASDLADPAYRDEAEAGHLYRILEEEVLPEFFSRNDQEIPAAWVAKIRKNFEVIAPAFSTRRMLDEYRKKYYSLLYERHEEFRANGFKTARQVAAWKERVREAWNEVKVLDMHVHDSSNQSFELGNKLEAQIALDIRGLDVNDIGVEILFIDKKMKQDGNGEHVLFRETLVPAPAHEQNGQVKYQCSIPMTQTGVFEYGFRIFPQNPLLQHRQDFSLIRWV